MSQAASISNQPIPLRLRLWMEVAAFLRILMITLWVTTWYQRLLSQRLSWGSAFLLLSLVVLISFYLSRLLERAHIDGGRARIVLGLWLAVALFSTLQWMVFTTPRAELTEFSRQAVEAVLQANPDIAIFLHLLVVTLLIWRGYSLANSSLDVGDTTRSFQTGVILFLLYGLVFGQHINSTSFFPVYIFLLLGLITLALTRITDLAFMRGGRLPGSFWAWIRPILLSSMLVVAFALAIGWLVSQQIGALSIAILALFFILILVLSALVAAPFLALIYLVLPWLQSRFSEGLEMLPIENVQTVADNIFGAELEELAKATTGIDRSFIIVLGAVLLAVIIAVLMSVRQRNARRKLAINDERIRNLAPSPFLSGSPDESDGQNRRFRRAGRLLAAAHIRRIYAQLMELADELGEARPAAATPLEYLPSLERLFPQYSSGLALITHAYLRIRYGELPETEAEVNQISAAWKEIRAEGHKRLREQRRKKKVS